MAKYVFFNFPTYGQVNPTLAIVQELVARGEEVVYFQSETMRAPIEAAGATLRAYGASLFRQTGSHGASATEDNRRLSTLPIHMMRTSRQMVPLLLERVRAEHPDCLVYSGLFLWARILAHALDIPGVALWPTYVPNAQVRALRGERLASTLSPATLGSLNDELAYLRDTYHLPFSDAASLISGREGLTIVFLPRAFQPGAETFDERFLFVGPSFHPARDSGRDFPREWLDKRPRLYIALGTLYNNRAEFYNSCFRAFGASKWQVVMPLGDQVDPDALQAVPENFITAPQVPQLEVLPQTDIFLSHGGMNSVMESLYFGVPLIVIPHTREQQMTAQRVQELGLGIALDETKVTADVLREAVERIAQEPGFNEHVLAMQRHIHEAGGYQRATVALQDYYRATRGDR